jgi:hypothetical protein
VQGSGDTHDDDSLTVNWPFYESGRFNVVCTPFIRRLGIVQTNP